MRELMHKYFAKVVDAPTKSTRAQSLWRGDQRWTNPAWTFEMTRALASAANDLLPDKRIAAKGVGDSYGRHEYLTLDVTTYDDTSWKWPAIIVEHENSPSAEKLRYCAWKLLSVRADMRVLVAYVDSTRRYSWCPSSPEALLSILAPVAADHRDQALTVFVGEWCGDLERSGWRGIFEVHHANVRSSASQ